MKYMKPHMEVISVEVEDVIRTSIPGLDTGDSLEQPGGNNPGEGGTTVPN